ncbi:MAG: hypothetical protein ABIJ09_07980 [Pseudomonadota bacterium]
MRTSSGIFLSRAAWLCTTAVLLAPLAARGEETDAPLQLDATAVDAPVTANSSGTVATPLTAETEATVNPRWHQDLGIDLALRLDAFVTQGQTFAVDLADGHSEGWHGVNGALDIELAYAPPLPSPWRIVSVALGVGYTPFIGTGLASWRAYTPTGEGVSHLTTTYRYDWAVHLIPISFGLRVQLPLETFTGPLPVRVDTEAGFAGGLAFASSSLTVDGADVPFARDVGSSDFGLGYYLGAGISVPVPPALGSVVVSYRYSAVRLDFHRPDFNATWGDLGGHHGMVGYRLEL